MTALRLTHGVSWAGLALGPFAWALSTQANYAWAPWACTFNVNAVPFVAAGLALLSFAGAALSWLAWRRHDGSGMPIPEQDGHPRNFLSGIGVGCGVLFGLVVVLQGMAALIIDPCLR
ncbi:MAG: hypothetical protein QOD74_3120 [Variibacter sp.]|jgi:hypothetical protein|nr:hypothetical protein [Variibacter sp.]